MNYNNRIHNKPIQINLKMKMRVQSNHRSSISIYNCINCKKLMIIFCFFAFSLMHLNTYASKVSGFQKLTSSNGLSHNTVYDIVQDQDGFMWFATRDGLNRFDGTSVEVYSPIESGSFLTDKITKIETNSKNDIVVLIENHIYIFNRLNSGFIKIPDDSVVFKIVFDIKIFSDDRIFICTNNGLFTSEYPYESIKQIKKFPELIYSVEELRDSTFILSSFPGIMNMDRDGNVFRGIGHYRTEEPLLLKNKLLNSLAEDKFGNLWIGSGNSGLYKYDRQKDLISHIDYPEFIESDLDIIRSITCNEDELYIGTEKGLLVFNICDNSWKQFNKSITDSRNHLNDNAVYSTYISREGILWLGTYFGGVNYSFINNEGFDNIYTGDKSGELNAKVIRQIIEGEDYNIYIATEDAGLFIYNPKNQIFTNYNTNNCGLKSNNIHSICFDHKQNLWIGTFMGGACRMNITTGEFKVYESKPYNSSTLTSNNIFSIVQDKNNRLWFGTPNGICYYDYTSDQFVRNPINLLKGVFVYYMFYDNDYLWFATKHKGLKCLDLDTYDIEDYKIENYPYMYNLNYGFKDSKEDIWLGTEDNGLIKIDRDTDSISIFNNSNLLSSNSVNAILEDDRQRLWISTNKGISCINTEDLTAEHYNVNHGLVHNQFNYTSCLRSKSGKIYFGGIDGITSFDPKKITPVNGTINLILHDFKLFNKSIEEFIPELSFEKTRRKGKIELKEKWNVITIEYKSITYLGHNEIRYAYYLEGFDEEWNYVNGKTDITYTNLKAGTYTFYLKGADGLNNWSDAQKMLQIQIVPPFYKTRIFIILMVIIIIISIFGLYHFRLKQIKKHNRELEQQVKQRTKELSGKNKELKQNSQKLSEYNQQLIKQRQMIEEQSEELALQRDNLIQMNETKDKLFSIIAHDIKSPFNSILGFSDILNSQLNELTNKEIVDYCGIINDTSRQLFEMMSGLLDWGRSQMGHVRVFPENISPYQIVENVFSILKKDALRKKNELINNINPDLIINADKNILSTVLRNIISNSNKYTTEGKIIASLSIQENMHFICVKDTGVGMSEDQQKRLFSIKESKSKIGTAGEKGTGLGLIVCSELLKIHESELHVNSILGKGSEFCFRIKI